MKRFDATTTKCLSALIGAIALSTTSALAAGSVSDTPPTPTQTTQACQDGSVWNEELWACVIVESSVHDDDALYQAAREFAYAGQYDHALAALAEMSDQSEDRVLTYLGFAHRRAGRTDMGFAFYAAALDTNPNNLLARSYLGQAFAEAGDLRAARNQLREIRSRGGARTWPATSLRNAIATGRGYDH